MPARKPKKANEALSRVSPFIRNVVGMKGWKVASCIGEGATDEQIEKHTKIKMAEIRFLLNQLHNHGIVEYNREKNLQTGWFTYTWKLNADRAFKNFISMKKREYQDLRDKLSSEENTVFYQCGKKCRKMPFDNAMEGQFKCPKCEGKMNAVDNRREIEDCRKKLETNESILLKMGENPPE